MIKEKQKSGFILINKPAGMSSHDVVDKLREITGIRKIGHAGTLDPFARGLLILGIGRKATKKLSYFLKEKKEYRAKIRLGAVSDTYDREGKIVLKQVKAPSEERVKEVLRKFLGKIKQIPPIFSAKKIKGKKYYQLARKGIKFSPEPSEVEIYKISLLSYKWPYLQIKVSCGSGTYIRSLAKDIGEALNCGGYLEELVRTRIGKFSLEKAVEISQLTPESWPKFLKKINTPGFNTINEDCPR